MIKQIILFKLLIVSFFSFSQNEYMLADNYYRTGEYEKAIVYYKRLAEKNPYNNAFIYKLTNCYQELEQFKEVENFITKQKQRNSNLFFLDIILGYNYEKQKQSEKADEMYRNVLNSIKEKEISGNIIAELFKKYNKLDYAIEAYEYALAKNPDSNFGFQMAQIYGEKGDFKKMFDSYIDLVDKQKEYMSTAKRYAGRYVTDDSQDENNILFKKALLRKSASNPKEEWNNLLSWLFIKQKEYNKAFIQVKALCARDINNLENMKQLSNLAFDNNDFETARKCNNFIIEKTNYKEDQINALLSNLQIDIKTNQPNITEKFEFLLKEKGINEHTISIQKDYANYLTYYLNDTEKAKEILKNALKLAKSKRQRNSIKLHLGDIGVFTGKFNKALILYTQIQNAYKNHTYGQYAQFKVAQTSYFKGDFKWAMAQLKVLKGSASQLTANDAADLFVTISDNLPKDSLSTGLKDVAKADLLTFQKKNKEAITLLSNVIKNYKGRDIEDDAIYKQAILFISEKEYEKAISNLEKVINNHKESVFIDDSLFKLAEIYNNQLKDTKKASEYYQKIIFEHPASIYLVDARKKFRKLRGDNI